MSGNAHTARVAFNIPFLTTAPESGPPTATGGNGGANIPPGILPIAAGGNRDLSGRSGDKSAGAGADRNKGKENPIPAESSDSAIRIRIVPEELRAAVKAMRLRRIERRYARRRMRAELAAFKAEYQAWREAAEAAREAEMH